MPGRPDLMCCFIDFVLLIIFLIGLNILIAGVLPLGVRWAVRGNWARFIALALMIPFTLVAPLWIPLAARPWTYRTPEKVEVIDLLFRVGVPVVCIIAAVVLTIAWARPAPPKRQLRDADDEARRLLRDLEQAADRPAPSSEAVQSPQQRITGDVPPARDERIQ